MPALWWHPEVLRDLRHDLRISELVGGLVFFHMLRQRLGAAQTLPELQFGLTRTEDQKGLRLPQLPDDVIVVPVKMLAVAFLVLFLSSPLSWTVCCRVPGSA